MQDLKFNIYLKCYSKFAMNCSYKLAENQLFYYAW